jgi:nickel-dependent lactate racemase
VAEGLVASRTVRASWGAWSDTSVDLALPASWDVVELTMRDAPALNESGIDEALDRPVDAPPIETLAAGRSRAVIAIDDITRPTRTAAVVSALVQRLGVAGISADAITILIATGAHRPATAGDVRLKVGDTAAHVRVVSHDPVADVVETGVSLAGQAVRVNRAWLAADLRIGISGVLPHPFAGFSGGGKIVLPGLADLDSVVRSHKYALMGFGGGAALENNKFRHDMERAVRQIGVDWTVNVVLNSRCETAAVVAGDCVAAHRTAAVRAREIGATAAPPRRLDALVLNAYPKDSELLQVEAALVPLRLGMLDWLNPGAPVALVGACPDGLGTHQLFGPGGRLFRKPAAKSYLRDRVLHIVSGATGADPTHAAFWDGYPYHATWESCARALARELPSTALVGYAPNGPLHVPQAGRPSGVEPSVTTVRERLEELR